MYIIYKQITDHLKNMYRTCTLLTTRTDRHLQRHPAVELDVHRSIPITVITRLWFRGRVAITVYFEALCILKLALAMKDGMECEQVL